MSHQGLLCLLADQPLLSSCNGLKKSMITLLLSLFSESHITTPALKIIHLLEEERGRSEWGERERETERINEWLWEWEGESVQACPSFVAHLPRTCNSLGWAGTKASIWVAEPTCFTIITASQGLHCQEAGVRDGTQYQTMHSDKDI